MFVRPATIAAQAVLADRYRHDVTDELARIGTPGTAMEVLAQRTGAKLMMTAESIGLAQIKLGEELESLRVDATRQHKQWSEGFTPHSQFLAGNVERITRAQTQLNEAVAVYLETAATWDVIVKSLAGFTVDQLS